jgi:hypothetical protein
MNALFIYIQRHDCITATIGTCTLYSHIQRHPTARLSAHNQPCSGGVEATKPWSASSLSAGRAPASRPRSVLTCRRLVGLPTTGVEKANSPRFTARHIHISAHLHAAGQAPASRPRSRRGGGSRRDRPRPPSEQGVRLAKTMRVGPGLPVGTPLLKVEVGPTPGPTWLRSHSTRDDHT